MSKAWTKDIILDPGTFGNSKACHVLVDMMNNNEISVYEKHRVLSLINTMVHTFTSVSYIPHENVREKTNRMWLDIYLAKIEQCYYPTKFKTFYKNVAYYLSRKYLRGAI